MTTILNYLIQPAQVFVATTTDLTLTISNPVSGDPVVFYGGRDPSLILITVPVGTDSTDLTTADTFTADTSTSGFKVSKSSGQYRLTVQSDNTTLNPGESIVVTFSNVAISTQTAQSSIEIDESISSGTQHTSVEVNKVEQELGIFAWIDPLTIGESATSTLWWQTSGGTEVTIDGSSSQPFPPSFPVKGNPPHTESYTLDAPIGQNAQTTYTLRVFADGKPPAIAYATLTKHVPVLTTFDLAEPTAQGGTKIGPTESANLAWTSVYATAAYWSGPLGQQQWYTNPTTSQYPQITPGLDVYNATADKTNLPGTAEYSVKLTGYDPTDQGHAVTKSLLVDIQPVELAFFKFANYDNGQLSGVEAQLIPEDWPGKVIETQQDKASVLTIYQPGGNNSVYYLGSEDNEHPQIQYFESSADGDNVTLNWITANLSSLTLNGENRSDIASGSATAESSGTYTLVGTAKDNSTVQSVLLVIIG